MLNQPQKVLEIYDRVREVVTCPLTMKLRTGFNTGQESYDDFYEILTGVAMRKIDAVTIHNRRVVHKFTGDVDYSVLAGIKRNFPQTIIIGSGDNFVPAEVVERIKTHQLDGMMIARGAIGNPWIFRSLNAIWEGKAEPAAPSMAEQGVVILRHFEILRGIYGPKQSVRHFRKTLIHYCRPHPMRKQVLRELIAIRSDEQLVAAIQKWYLNWG
jgi:tRNA-dihydrouridine synthase B